MLRLQVSMVRKVYLDRFTPEGYRLTYKGAVLYEGSSPEALDAATKAATSLIETAYPGEDSKVYRNESRPGEGEDTREIRGLVKRALSPAYDVTRKI